MPSSESQGSVPIGRIALDGIEAEQFDLLVDLLARWISGGEIKVRFRVARTPVLDFDEENIAQQVKNNQLPGACISQLRTDIPLMLFGILAGFRSVVTSFLVAQSEPPERKGAQKASKAQIRQEVVTRIKCVEDKLVTSDLRRQYAVKSTAKTDTYLGVSWDVVEKHGESTGGLPPGLVHATVRIAVEKPAAPGRERGTFLPFVFEFGPAESEGLTLTMTLQDVQDLVENLGKAVKALRQATETKGGA